MTDAQLFDWRLPGCGDRCIPRRHDPHDHEAYGYQQALENQAPKIVRTGHLEIDRDRQVVWSRGRPVALSATEWRLLAHLARRPGVLCSHRDLIAAAWPGDGVTGHEILRVNLSRLWLRLQAAELFENAFGRGYRLRMVDPVEYPRAPVQLTPRPWARQHAACRSCGTQARPHAARGFCGHCYWHQHRKGRLR